MRLEASTVILYRDGSAGSFAQLAKSFLATAVFAAWTMWAFSSHDKQGGQIAILLGAISLFFVVGLAATIARLFRRGTERAPCSDVDIDRGVVRTWSNGRLVEGALTAGWLERGSDGAGAAVELSLASGDVLVARVPGEVEGEALLDALGLDARRHAVPFPLEPAAASGWGRRAFILLTTLGAILLGTVIHGTHLFAATLGVGLAFGLAFLGWGIAKIGSGVAVVGTDGIALRTGARRRFIPYADIRDVYGDRRGTRLVLRRGRTVRLVTPERSASDTAVRDALAARIREGMAAVSTWPSAGARWDRLDRKGRAFDAWLRDARAALATDPGYRSASFTRDDLAGLVEDVAAPVERRVAAAAALGADGEPSVRVRVDAAVGACASESLRDALAKAYAGELDETTLDRARASLGT